MHPPAATDTIYTTHPRGPVPVVVCFFSFFYLFFFLFFFLLTLKWRQIAMVGLSFNRPFTGRLASGLMAVDVPWFHCVFVW